MKFLGTESSPWIRRYGSEVLAGALFTALLLGLHVGVRGEADSEVSSPRSAEATDSLSLDPAVELWRVIRDSTDPRDFREFVANFPDSSYVHAANAKIKRLIEETNLEVTASPDLREATEETSKTPSAEAQSDGLATNLEPRCRGFEMEPACWLPVQNKPGCHVWSVNPRLEERASFEGSTDCVNEKLSGYGALTWEAKLKGEWTTKTWPAGPYMDGKRHGTWEFLNSDGDELHGTYKDGVRHGPWRFSRSDESSVRHYDFVDGELQGDYVRLDANGSYTEGTFKDGERHGEWTLYEADGDLEDRGTYVDGEKHGQWVEEYAFGAVHRGSYVGGQRSGEWVLENDDGTVARGPYVDGKRHGQWIWEYADGTVERDRYVNGERQDD